MSLRQVDYSTSERRTATAEATSANDVELDKATSRRWMKMALEEHFQRLNEQGDTPTRPPSHMSQSKWEVHNNLTRLTRPTVVSRVTVVELGQLEV